MQIKVLIIVTAVVSTFTSNALAAPCAPSGTSCTHCTSYRCNAGYYGTPTSTTYGCTACPNGGTSNKGATTITDCYLPDGHTGTDNAGTYTISGGRCTYAN